MRRQHSELRKRVAPIDAVTVWFWVLAAAMAVLVVVAALGA